MTIFTTHLFALVHRHFMTFSFLSARHILNDFTLVLKAINIRPPFIKSKPLIEKGRKNQGSSVHILEELLVVLCLNDLFTHELHALDRILVSKVFSQQPCPREFFLRKKQLLFPGT